MVKSKKNRKEEKCCDNCSNRETGWDGGFFGEPVTCDCRYYGVTENRDNCDKFQRRITISEKVAMLTKKIKELQEENKLLKEYINTIFDNRPYICSMLDIEDAKFYCAYKKDYVNRYFCRNENCEEKCDRILIDLYEEISREVNKNE